MTPLLKGLLGNGSRDREQTDQMRAVLLDMQQERARCETLLDSVRESAQRLLELGEPIAKAGSDTDAVVARVAEMQQRLASLTEVTGRFQELVERSEGLAQSHQQAAQQIATTLADTQQIRSVFEGLSQKVDLAGDLQGRLEAFMDVDKPFSQLRGEAEGIRSHVEGTGEQLARLREQHERLIDAHKLAMSKMEALDRRRDDIGRSLTDKERRVAAVEQSVHAMDGVQNTIDDMRREVGALKALGDSVIQKTAALEAQRGAVERALAQADHLDRAMRQLDAGVRQQQENEKALRGLQEDVSALRNLHETVVERSREISQLQHDTEEHIRGTRHDLTGMTEEMKKTVERFDFESQGLETVSQRVADLRGTLTDCENRFKPLGDASMTVATLTTRAQELAVHLRTLSDEAAQADENMTKFQAIRRDVDETGRAAGVLHAQLAHVEELRPTLDAAVRDLQQLAGVHATVHDALEQTQLVHAEMARVREGQSETRAWLMEAEQSLAGMRDQIVELRGMAPGIELVQKQADRLVESTTAIEARREHLDDMNRRLAELSALAARLDERDRQLHTRMEAAEQRFVALSDRSEEAQRLSQTIAGVSSGVEGAGRQADSIAKAVSAIASRCEAVEELAERTRALRPELDQRHKAVTEATKNLHRASQLRKEAANSAQQLEELAARLAEGLTAANERATRVEEQSTQLEARGAHLKTVEKRLDQFEKRLAEWDPVEKDITRSLEQMSSRQGTVEALRADLERMYTMAEKTAGDVREITSAHQEIEQSRMLLKDVMGRLREVRDTTSALDERKRQMVKAEERLSRAEALLQDVQSSLDALQGQKAIVEQAVEKAGSLQFLLKQAEATIDGLREEREMTARVRAAVGGDRRGEEAAEAEARAA